MRDGVYISPVASGVAGDASGVFYEGKDWKGRRGSHYFWSPTAGPGALRLSLKLLLDMGVVKVNLDTGLQYVQNVGRGGAGGGEAS